MLDVDCTYDTRTFSVLPLPELDDPCRLLEDSHLVDSHPVLWTRVCSDAKVVPKCAPNTLTLTLPEEAAFCACDAVTVGRSKETPSVPVPTPAPEVTFKAKLEPNPWLERQLSCDSEVHSEDSHCVRCKDTKPDVPYVPKFVPCTTTAVSLAEAKFLESAVRMVAVP